MYKVQLVKILLFCVRALLSCYLLQLKYIILNGTIDFARIWKNRDPFSIKRSAEHSFGVNRERGGMYVFFRKRSLACQLTQQMLGGQVIDFALRSILHRANNAARSENKNTVRIHGR